MMNKQCAKSLEKRSFSRLQRCPLKIARALVDVPWRFCKAPFSMKLSITTKLFLAVLATVVLAVVTIGTVSRWNFARGFAGYLNEQGVERMEAALPSVVTAYRQHGSWDFLRDNPVEWLKIIRPGRVPAASTELSAGSLRSMVGGPPGAMSRLLLLDRQRNVIGGFRKAPEGAAQRAVVVDGETVGWLVMIPFDGASDASDRRFQRRQAQTSWIVSGLAVLMAAGIAWWVSRALLAPVRRVAVATHRLAAGDYAGRVDVTSQDEVGQLARDFNSLADSLQRNEEMRRAFVADVSHELRTPLGVLHGELEAMEDGVRPLSLDAVRSLQHEVDLLNKLVDDLYDLSLADVGALIYAKVESDLREILELAVDAFRGRFAAAGIAVEMVLPAEPLIVFADERRIQQLFNNLLSNACRYTNAGGLLRIRAREEGGQLVVDFMDSEPGIDADLIPRLFERFFRGESSRNRASGGAGLGLAICRSLAEAHGGRIEAQSSPLGGLWLTLHLPRAKTQHEEASQ
jgi:two-component system sensor histidine kinase BaeS